MVPKDLIRYFTAHLWPSVVAIFLVGLAVRCLLLSLLHFAPVLHVEAINIAISLLTKGVYADPYGGPTGASAHCMPLHPLLSAVLIQLFGLGPGGSRAISYVASCAASLGYALLPLLAVNCGLRKRVGVSAGLFGALLPINFWGQTSGLFDAPYTFLTLVVLACLVAGHLRAESFTLAGGLTSGSAAAVSLMLNPLVLPVLAVWFVCAWVYYSDRRATQLRYGAVVWLIVVAALLPWSLRNKAQLGRLILTRSNFGLEFQVSNNDVATADLETNVRNESWQKLHPLLNAEQREKVSQLGEVAYNQAKLEEAVRWLKESPRHFLRLSAGRISLFWFPRMARALQTILQISIMVLAILGFVALLKANLVPAVFLGSTCVAYSLVYIVIEVSPRYRFPIEGFLLLFGSYFVCEVALGRRSRPLSQFR